MSTLPCMRNEPPTYTLDLPIPVEDHNGVLVREYDCRITYEVDESGFIVICSVEVPEGKDGAWVDCGLVLTADQWGALYDNAERLGSIQSALLEHARDSADWAADNADAMGHAHREKLEEL